MKQDNITLEQGAALHSLRETINKTILVPSLEMSDSELSLVCQICKMQTLGTQI